MNELKVEKIVRWALEEDLGRGDITSESIVPPGACARAVIRAKQEGVIAGVDVARRCFSALSDHLTWHGFHPDGQRCVPQDRIIEVQGPAIALLGAERVALNFLQRMSGIATLTRKMVDQVAPYGARIVDTRKTVPLLRMLDKYAVRAGGGLNHRFGLDDGVLIKENHIAVAGGIAQAVGRLRQAVGHMVKVEVEVTDMQQLQQALAENVDAVLLDNMSLEQMEEAVGVVAGRCLVEASGNITFDNCRAIAETGVDVLSVGWLTHSVDALDLSMIVTIGGVATNV